MNNKKMSREGYCIFSEYRDEFISAAYNSLEDLQLGIEAGEINFEEEEDVENLVIYKLSEVKSKQIIKKHVLDDI